MPQQVRDHLGRFGVWRAGRQLTPDLAVSLEQLGFGTLWVGGSPGGDLAVAESLLDATTALTVATGVVNVWRADARELGASFRRVDARHPGRFLLGVGAGHRESAAGYARPYETVARYVDALRGQGVPAASLVLAALGPRMLRLAADRTAGAHPYLVPPEHTRGARALLGPGALLAPEQKVVLEEDPQRARAIARPAVQNPYLGLVNYTANLRRLGWSDADLSGGGSDALIDALVAQGSASQVVARLEQHLSAGADHVAIQLLTAPGADPLPGYGELARALQLTGAPAVPGTHSPRGAVAGAECAAEPESAAKKP